MTLANDWLKRNPQFTVLNCECIERPLDTKGQAESDATIRLKGRNAKMSFVRGVRYHSKESQTYLLHDKDIH